MENSTKHPKILIADPEPFVRDTLKIKLRSKKMEVDQAESGKDMVRIAGRDIPDLIITEINFKDIDAYRAMQILKGNSRTKDIPIIILTREEKTPEKTFLFGPYVSRFITKPFSPREVAKTVQEVLARPLKMDIS